MTNLKNLFRINVKDNTDEVTDKIQPLRSEQKKEKKVFNRENWDEETLQLYKWWWTTTHIDVQDYKNRKLMYEDQDILFQNCMSIIKAGEIICDEIIQADSNNQPIFIDAKAPIKKFIEEFFDKININYYLRQTIKDFIKYGNAGWVLEFDETGVSKIIPVNLSDICSLAEEYFVTIGGISNICDSVTDIGLPSNLEGRKNPSIF
jgi:hypothetical protein